MAVQVGRDGDSGRCRGGSPGLLLFVCLFAAQVSGFVVAPVLPMMARDFDAPVAVLGELRALVGLMAGLSTFALAVLPRPISLRILLAVGLGCVVAGSLSAALAGGLVVLACAHLLLGCGLGVVLTAAMAATAQWAAPGQQTRVLSVALMGPPSAAVLGPLVAGVLAHEDWRLAWWCLPFAASLLALGGVLRRRERGERATRVRLGPMWQRPHVTGWFLGELLAYAAWSGIPVFAGALLVESYAVGPVTAGLSIAASAVCFVVGNALTRRWGAAAPRPVLASLSGVLALAAGAFGVLRPGFGVSAALLMILGFAAGGRALTGSALGLRLAATGQPVAAMALRTTAQQFGYLGGTALGGVALAVASYPGLGVQMAALFALAALPHLSGQRRSPSRADQTSVSTTVA